jgi:hypothetical protein
MGLGEKDGEEFDQVKVALVPVLEPNVQNEFGLGGHVVVSDHAAVPPVAELHSDESSDEMVRGRGGGVVGWRVGEERYVGEGVTVDPSCPMGQRGLRWVGKWGRDFTVSPPVGTFVERIYGGTSQRSPLVSPSTYIGGGDRGGRWGRWRRQLWVRGRLWGRGIERPSASGDGYGAGLRDGIGGRARADRREASGGYTRCSRRYCRQNRRVRVRVRVEVR